MREGLSCSCLSVSLSAAASEAKEGRKEGRKEGAMDSDSVKRKDELAKSLIR